MPGQLALFSGREEGGDTTWCVQEWCPLPADVYVRGSRRFWWPYCNAHAPEPKTRPLG